MKLVTVRDVVELIRRRGLETVLGELTAYLEHDFKRWPDFQKDARYASHSKDGVIELMPTSDGAQFGFKYVNGHPQNGKLGLQTVVAFGVLSDVRTGYPLMISEMTITTALRTAGTSVLAARALARPEARTMAIIGLGAQSEFQARAFRALTGIRKLRVYDVDPAATDKFLANMASIDVEAYRARGIADAVAGADIITTVTADKRQATVLSDNHVGAGVHLNAIGGDCPGKTELQASIVQRAQVFVEFAEQTRHEGEIQQMPADFPVTELWQVLTGAHPGRRSPNEITLFDSVGFALEDFSALRYIYDQVSQSGLFATADLLAAPGDPRDLIGLIGTPAPARSNAA